MSPVQVHKDQSNYF